MRRSAPSFVTEFKTRSSKSAAPRSSAVVGDAAEGSKPFFLDTTAFFVGQSTTDRGREAAIVAAEALFGVDKAATPIGEEPPSALSPVGRVLPSLIEEDDALTVRLREADNKRRRGRKAKKVATASVVRRQKQIPQTQHMATPAPIEPSVINIDPEQAQGPARRREHRSIQKRWVLKTELKAGEKWKRRLHRAAK